MTAIACLRILIADRTPAPPPEPVQAAAEQFLRRRWTAPRRFGAVAPLAFVLADLRAERLDTDEMQALAVELEAGLFPGEATGQVCLMTFEGDESAVLQFASLSKSALAGLMAGRGYAGPPGEVKVITAQSVRSAPSAPSAPPVAAAAPAPAAPPTPEPRAAPPRAAAPVSAPQRPAQAAPVVKPPPVAATGWWGLCHLPSDTFVGAAIGLRADLTLPRPTDDSALLTRDLTGLNDAQAAFAKAGDSGLLFVPFSFWNLTTPASQEAYKRRLSRYPLDLKDRLGATIYDTPREPSLGLLAQIRAFLAPSFAFIDLNIVEANFPVATLPGDLVTSLSLTLQGEDARERIAAIAGFAAISRACQAKGVRQAVVGVRDAAELEACRAAGLRFVAGPALSTMLDRPVGAAPAIDLPLRAA